MRRVTIFIMALVLTITAEAGYAVKYTSGQVVESKCLHMGDNLVAYETPTGILVDTQPEVESIVYVYSKHKCDNNITEAIKVVSDLNKTHTKYLVSKQTYTPIY